MKRRQFLNLAAIDLAAFAATPTRARAAAAEPELTLARLKAAPGHVVADGGATDVELTRTWDGALCRASVTNRGKQPVRVREIVLFSLTHHLPPETELHGESFQMLSLTGGQLGRPEVLGYDEVKHYKVPQPAGVAHAVTGLLLLTPPGQATALFGFTSCRRFAGRFFLRAAEAAKPARIDVAIEAEGLALAPGETWALEEFTFATGPDRAAMLADLAARINVNHPPLRTAKPPTGWCSWYHFGPRVTAEDVRANLAVIAKKVPALRYVQVDDGYQPAMGDWLDTGKAFGGDVAGVLAAIRKRGFEPAIWVAPFIAEAGSQVFRAHPDWFIKGDDGKPLPSDRVSFGGWRRGPWYVLDGTHPAVAEHFTHVFTVMREKWGCSYFKLDANFWGMLHGGRFHDGKATRIEAYRRGMNAILRGTGPGFVLGCNHPIWASFGLIHGSRSSNDVKRTWPRFKQIARQTLSRNWQNGTLWWNDPDAVVLTGALSEDEFRYHATAAYASGGMILSGDDLTKIPPARLAMLKKLLPPSGNAATFDDASLRIGRLATAGAHMLCLFNHDDQPQTLEVPLHRPCVIADVWGGFLGPHRGTVSFEMPPHSARLLQCRVPR